MMGGKRSQESSIERNILTLLVCTTKKVASSNVKRGQKFWECDHQRVRNNAFVMVIEPSTAKEFLVKKQSPKNWTTSAWSQIWTMIWTGWVVLKEYLSNLSPPSLCWPDQLSCFEPCKSQFRHAKLYRLARQSPSTRHTIFTPTRQTCRRSWRQLQENTFPPLQNLDWKNSPDYLFTSNCQQCLDISRVRLILCIQISL